MAHRSSPAPARQVAPFCRRFTEAAGLPFAEVLPAEQVQQALQAEQVRFRDRLFRPAVTL